MVFECSTLKWKMILKWLWKIKICNILLRTVFKLVWINGSSDNDLSWEYIGSIGASKSPSFKISWRLECSVQKWNICNIYNEKRIIIHAQKFRNFQVGLWIVLLSSFKFVSKSCLKYWVTEKEGVFDIWKLATLSV